MGQNVSKFYGKQDVVLDAKGRFVFPMKHKKSLNDLDKESELVVVGGMGPFIKMFTKTQWELQEQAMVNKMNESNEEEFEMKEDMMDQIEFANFDSASRLSLDTEFLEAIQVKSGSKIMLVGFGDSINIYNYDEYMKKKESRDNDALKKNLTKYFGQSKLNNQAQANDE